MNNKELEIFKGEVKEVHAKILKECQKNEELNSLYKGCQIFYTPYRNTPDVLFIGLNPGGGYAKANSGRIVESFEPLEAVDPNDLMYEARNCFRDVGIENILNNAVVTNGRFFATNGMEELLSFFTKLSENLRNEVKIMSAKWIQTLIKIISPKMIMCLGNTSFDYLHEVYNQEIVIIENKNSPLEAKIGNIPVIGCQRNGSTIIKREALVERLREYVKEIAIL